MMSRVRAALLVVACLVGLTGCVRFDADLNVHSNETVSGTMQLGVDKQLMQSSGQSLEKIRGQIEDTIKEQSTDGVTCEPYEDDRYVGSRCEFENVPFEKMGNSTGEGVVFRKDGDKIIVAVKDSDLGVVPSGSQPSVSFKVTMPGKILEHDGGASISGRTATYDSLDKLGDVSLTSEAGSSFPIWLLIVVILLVLLAVAAFAFLVLRGRKAQPQQNSDQYGQYPGQPQQGQRGPQYGGQPGQPGYGQQGGHQPGQYGGQTGQYPGQPGSAPHQGQPGQPQYPGQPQQGQWGQQSQQGQGGWGQQPSQPPAPPQQQRPPAPEDGSEGGWGQQPKDNGQA